MSFNYSLNVGSFRKESSFLFETEISPYGLLLGVAGVANLEVLCVHGQNLTHGRRGVSEILDRYAVGKSGLIFHVWSS